MWIKTLLSELGVMILVLHVLEAPFSFPFIIYMLFTLIISETYVFLLLFISIVTCICHHLFIHAFTSTCYISFLLSFFTNYPDFPILLPVRILPSDARISRSGGSEMHWLTPISSCSSLYTGSPGSVPCQSFKHHSETFHIITLNHSTITFQDMVKWH